MNDDPERGFIDSNVLVYAHDTSAGPKREAAGRLIRGLAESRNGALSLQVLQEFFVISTSKIPRPIESREAVTIISDFGAWTLHQPVLADVVAAAEIHRSYGISLWDALIVRSAAQLNCSVIWSEDLNPGQTYEGVRCENPFKA